MKVTDIATLRVGDKVRIDGDREGYIRSINPNGSGCYVGPQHAYVFVRIPSLDCRDYLTGETNFGGRAVVFNEIAKRLEAIDE